MKKNMRCPVCGKRRKMSHDLNFKIIFNEELDQLFRAGLKKYYICNDVRLAHDLKKKDLIKR